LFGLTPETPLTDLQGMNPWNAARLNEEGIDNVQNLATEGPSRLIVVTTEGGLRILDWIDQAILFSAVGKKLRDDLAEQGITTSARRAQVGPPLRRLLSR
jgi:predicted flap endonuclease-1-like 5' DNA nuclease